MIPIYPLIPTRKRPEKLRRSITSLKDLARYPDRVRVLAYADDDDPTDYNDFAIEHMLRGPRWGYKGLHVYFNELARRAVERDRLDGATHSFMLVWNDDEIAVTQDWDEKLCTYGSEPKVVFMRRDCYAADTAYPAVNRAFFDLVGTLGDCAALDTWLAIATCAADRLIGRTATHVHAPDIAVRHERDERDTDGFVFDGLLPPSGISKELAAFRLAEHYGAPFDAPFGFENGVPIRK